MFVTVRCIYKVLSSIKWHKRTKKSKVISIIKPKVINNKVGQQVNKSTFDDSANMFKRVETYGSSLKINASKPNDHYYQNTDQIKRYIE